MICSALHTSGISIHELLRAPSQDTVVSHHYDVAVHCAGGH